MEIEHAPLSVRPDILQYKDYRIFLSHFYRFKKSHRSGFSFRRFSELSQMKSPNYLQLVIQGKRNLSKEAAINVGAALKLSKLEQQCFLSLVSTALAETTDERESAQREHLQSLALLLKKQIPQEKAEILSRWHHLVIREVITYPSATADPAWISDQLRGLVSPKEVEHSLELLLRNGFLQIVDGRYSQSESVIETGAAFGEVQVLGAHAEILILWAKNLATFYKDERELGVMNIPINAKKIPELKKKIRQFQNELVGWLQDEKEADQVVQLGTYLIPITKRRN